MTAKSCKLVCVADSHPPIPLRHKEAVIVGRSSQTQIKDTRCSRKQVELTANFQKLTAVVKQIGSNSTSVGDEEIGQNQSREVTEKDKIFILSGEYPHRIVFEVEEEEKLSGKGVKSSVVHVNGPKASSKVSDFFGQKSNVHTGSLKRKLNESDSVEKKFKSDDNSDSEDEEHKKYVEQQLKLMQEMAKSCPPSDSGRQSKAKPVASSEKERGVPCKEAHWDSHDNKLLIHTSKGVQASSKIAGFDMDGTIICTQSGKRFPTDCKDWKIMFFETYAKLKKLIEDGYKVVFFTNQLGIGRGRQNEDDFKKKVESIIAKLDIPVQVFIAKYSDIYRKPAPGAWDFLSQRANDGIEIDMEKSFYVGDAAGRPEKWAPKKKKDFSCSDRLFALNLKLTFHTPEEYFLKYNKAPFNMPEFDPRKLSPDDPLTCSNSPIIASNQEMIVNVGCPAAGKSFFCKQYLAPKGYAYVNRDELGSWQKCVAACKQALSKGSSVVIDNTNPDPESRSRYLNVAKELKIPSRCFLFTASHSHCRHNEKFREITDSGHQPINDMIMNSYKSKFTEPSLSEGFTEIVKVNFVPKFKDKKLEKLYGKFLLEK